MKYRLCRAAIAAALTPLALTAFAQAQFPFEREIVLDVQPLPGSKRVPMLEIFADGRAQIDLWCRSGEGRAEVEGETIKFTLGPMQEERCTPERSERDDQLAASLAEVTRWRLEDDVVVLTGSAELRFRLSTH